MTVFGGHAKREIVSGMHVCASFQKHRRNRVMAILSRRAQRIAIQYVHIGASC